MYNVLDVKNVTKEYRDFKLNNISFTIGTGEILGLIGANGAGKTTIIKIIMDLIRVQEGIVEIFGKPWKNNEKSIKCRIGYIPDSNFLPEHLTPIFIEKIMKSFFNT